MNIFFNIRPYTSRPYMLDSDTHSPNLERYISRSAINFVREVFPHAINTCGTLQHFYTIMNDYFTCILAEG
jgi:hypothetical protein